MEDISKNTIAVLLILVVIISIIGTWVVLNALVTPSPIYASTDYSQSQGTVRLNLLTKQETDHESVTMQGNVKLTVLRPGEEEKGG